MSKPIANVEIEVDSRCNPSATAPSATAPSAVVDRLAEPESRKLHGRRVPTAADAQSLDSRALFDVILACMQQSRGGAILRCLNWKAVVGNGSAKKQIMYVCVNV